MCVTSDVHKSRDFTIVNPLISISTQDSFYFAIIKTCFLLFKFLPVLDPRPYSSILFWYPHLKDSFCLDSSSIVLFLTTSYSFSLLLILTLQFHIVLDSSPYNFILFWTPRTSCVLFLTLHLTVPSCSGLLTHLTCQALRKSAG